jgi:sugar phosphate isomerase/epimerase
MKLNFHKSFWEAECNTESELTGLLQRVQSEGYHGTELFLPFYPIDIDTTLKAHEKFDLNIITGIATDGTTPADHLNSMNTQVINAVEYSPKHINCHTGRDIFSLDDNLKLFENALSLEQKYGVTITHETHRFRPTFSTFETEKIVSALPELKLNLDISHWMVVHESDLSDQAERLQRVFPSVHHIHARVGFEEGPQITSPQEARWESHLNNHTQLWQNVIQQALLRGDTDFTITPEFGPFPYAHTHPETEQALTDVWASNKFMKDHLSANLTCA